MLPDGTVSNPSLAFTNSPSTGLYRSGADQMSITANGAIALTVKNNQYVGIGNTITNPQAQLEAGISDTNYNTITDVVRLDHYTTGTADNGLGAGILFYGQNSLGAGQNLARIASQVEHATTSEGFLANLSFYTVGTGGLLEKMRLTGNGQLALATTTVPTGYGANIATSTFVYGSLTVGGTSKLTVSVIDPYLIQATGTLIFASGNSAGADDFIFQTAGTEKIRILENGYVGIGTTTPDAKLNVVGDTAGYELISDFKSGTSLKKLLLYGDAFNNDSGTFLFQAPSGIVLDGAGSNTQLDLNSSGKVGIATTSPQYRLEVGYSNTAPESIAVTNTNGGTGAYAQVLVNNDYDVSMSSAMRMLTMGTGYTSVGGFVQDSGVLDADIGLSGGLSIMTRANAPIRFYTNGHTNERMRIDETGNVGIGTSTGLFARTTIAGSGSTSATAALSVVNSASTSLLFVRNDGNVGIGTTNPGAALDVNGSTLIGLNTTNRLNIANWFSNTAIWIDIPTSGPSVIGSGGVGTGSAWIAYAAGAGNWFTDSQVGDIAYRNTSGKLLFGNTSGAAGMALSGNNLGIGTTTPDAKLNVVGDTAGYELISDFKSGTSLKKLLLYGDAFNNDGGTFLFQAPSGIVLDGAGSNTQLDLNSSGNVGIGTTNPGATLTVAGGRGQFTGTTAPSSGAGVEIGYDGTNGIILAYNRTTPAYKDLQFQGGAVTMQGGGNVGIGTTNPLVKFHVENTAAVNDVVTTPVLVRAGADGTLGPLAFQVNLNPSATAGNRYVSLTAGDNIANRNLVLNPTSGNVGIGTTGPGGHGSGAAGPFLDLYGSGIDLAEYYIGNAATAVDSWLGVWGAYTTGASAAEEGAALIGVKTDALSSTNVSGRIEFYTNNAGTFGDPKMVIEAGGNVGIGVTDPTRYKLNVRWNVQGGWGCTVSVTLSHYSVRHQCSFTSVVLVRQGTTGLYSGMILVKD